MDTEYPVSPRAPGVERAAPGDDPHAIIQEYQRRRAEFRPWWNRNFLLFALPGFTVFALGGPVLQIPALALAGFAIFALGMLRGFVILYRHLRCPVCDRLQSPQWCYPHRVCLGCGAALSYGPGDS
jgi:hypothetical protein